MNNNEIKLALFGGEKVRNLPFPGRKLFDVEELDAIREVFQHAWEIGKDFGYQEKFEELYTNKFVEYQGGGYADAVSSGTAGIMIALSCLELKPKSTIVLSPVTDPGSISPVFLLGFKGITSDSMSFSYNMGPDEFAKCVNGKVSAVIVTHVAGVPAPMREIVDIAKQFEIKIIEDCSQAHGAEIDGKKVGTFGDVAVFSTMFSKNHASGGCGGLVYTKNYDLYKKARSFADRGKAFFDPNYDPKDPRKFLFNALNFNQDELSCAIGRSTLMKLDATINKRNLIVDKINESVESKCKLIEPCLINKKYRISPFFLPIKFVANYSFDKNMYLQALLAEGATINPNYKYVVSEWSWVKGLLDHDLPTPNASRFRENSFNILFHENFKDNDVNDLIECLVKVDNYFSDRC